MRWAVLLALVFGMVLPAAAVADEPLDRTIWRRVEIAPGVSQDYEVRFQYRVPMAAHE